jgi:hypothetical protein
VGEFKYSAIEEGADHPQHEGSVAGGSDSILKAFRLPALRSLGELADRALLKRLFLVVEH